MSCNVVVTSTAWYTRLDNLTRKVATPLRMSYGHNRNDVLAKLVSFDILRVHIPPKIIIYVVRECMRSSILEVR